MCVAHKRQKHKRQHDCIMKANSFNNNIQAFNNTANFLNIWPNQDMCFEFLTARNVVLKSSFAKDSSFLFNLFSQKLQWIPRQNRFKVHKLLHWKCSVHSCAHLAPEKHVFILRYGLVYRFDLCLFFETTLANKDKVEVWNELRIFISTQWKSPFKSIVRPWLISSYTLIIWFPIRALNHFLFPRPKRPLFLLLCWNAKEHELSLFRKSFITTCVV